MQPTPTSHLDDLLSELVSAQLADQVLTEMEIRANDLGLPLVGRAVGRFLELQVRAAGARSVVDVGGHGGYTTWWVAGAVGPDGRVTLAVPDPRERAAAEAALRRADRFTPVTTTGASALEVLAAATDPAGDAAGDAAVDAAGDAAGDVPIDVPVDVSVDVVHLHAEVVRGEDGVAAFEAAVRAVRPGGLVLATGVTPGGVADPAGLAVCRAAADEPALVSSVVPIRDGVLVALRTGTPTAPR